ncbi:MAG: SAM-dependent methyltransferase [Bacteroidales bacterium]|nr:SAM-dependent methyltransferase [Bacteroidales bacterium]
MTGKLFLIPTTIGTPDTDGVIPSRVIETTKGLKHFVVEELRTARRYLSRVGVSTPIDSLEFFELNEHTSPADVDKMLVPILNGSDMGLLSEAGVPAVADPGSLLVATAHRKGIAVVPLVGPNSILLTLMASGLNGQNFAFVGYLPVKPDERKKRIKQLEQRSRSENQTQLFIEAPYRNVALFRDLLQTCSDETLLTIGCELTTAEEQIRTKKIKDWRQSPIPDINKRNTVFGFLF